MVVVFCTYCLHAVLGRQVLPQLLGGPLTALVRVVVRRVLLDCNVGQMNIFTRVKELFSNTCRNNSSTTLSLLITLLMTLNIYRYWSPSIDPQLEGQGKVIVLDRPDAPKPN